MGKTALTYCVGIDKHFSVRDKTANSLGFTGHIVCVTTVKFFMAKFLFRKYKNQ